MRVGTLLPHFSDRHSWDHVMGLTPRIEELGFDGVWVRDNLNDKLLDAAGDGDGRKKMGSIPLVSLAASRGEALKKIANRTAPLISYLSNRWKLQIDDLDEAEGAIILGNVDDVTPGLQAFAARGADLVVLDPRPIMEEFEGVIEVIGRDVLPALGQHSRRQYSHSADGYREDDT